MLDVKYYKDYGHNYLILQDTEEAPETIYQRRMITGNRIRGLIPCQERHVNGDTFLYYEITSRQSFIGMYEGKRLGMSWIKSFFVQLREICDSLQHYLLEESHLVLHPEYIFQHPQKEEFFFLYYPGDFPNGNGFQELVHFITDRVDNDDMEAVETIYKVAELMSREGFVLDEVLSWFQGHWEERENTAYSYEQKQTEEDWPIDKKQVPVQYECDQQKEKMPSCGEEFQEESGKPVQDGGNKKNPGIQKLFRGPIFMGAGIILAVILLLIMRVYELSYYEEICLAVAWIGAIACFLWGGIRYFCEKDVKEGKKAEKGCLWKEDYKYMEAYTEEPEFGGSADTVFIPWVDSCENKLYGVDKGNKYHIDLRRLPLTVGKMAGAVDLLINEQGISRIHARFSRQGDKIYVMDLNSTNGTFKNGMRLEPNASEVIEPGDEIGLGKLKFIYR